MRWLITVVLFASVACGGGTTPTSERAPESSPTGAAAAAETPPGGRAAGEAAPKDSACDTAFVFATPQPSDDVVEVMRSADLAPVETRFRTEGAANGTTSGGIGSPGYVGTVAQVESALEMAAEMHGVEPLIVGIRVSGDVDAEALGSLAGLVHTRTLVPKAAAVVMTSPDVGGNTVDVVGGATCG